MATFGNRLPVGPGSRGGTFHEDPAAYHRQYRRDHPEYRQAERERGDRRRRDQREAKALGKVAFREALVYLMARDVLESSKNHVGTVMGVNAGRVGEWLLDARGLGGDSIDAAVAFYGLGRIRAAMQITRDHAQDVIARAAARSMRYVRLEACKDGHPFTEENTIVVRSTGKRRCKTCANARKRESWARRKGDMNARRREDRAGTIHPGARPGGRWRDNLRPG